jgi:hypothetical protein
MTKNITLLASFLALMCFLLLTSSSANAYLVFPDDPYWNADVRGEATAAITAQKPNNGNASLALTTSGLKTTNNQNDPLNDWGFYTRYSDSSQGWGLLDDIWDLSFDWYRDTPTTPGGTSLVSWDPWRVQTPALRLYIKDNIYNANNMIIGTFESELVWEAYYSFENFNSTKDRIMIGGWVDQSLVGEGQLDQNFWRHTISIEGYTVATGQEVYPYLHDQLLKACTVSEWASGYYSNDAYIYGLSVGVGSMWPYAYNGFVDNVYLTFSDSTGNITTVLNDNFELPVPEPATLLLFGSGMGIMALGRRWRRKKDNA